MDSLLSTWRGSLLQLRFSHLRLRTMARHALEGQKPAGVSAWLEQPAVKELGSSYAAWLLVPPYWASEVTHSLLAALVLATLAAVAFLGWTPLDVMVAANASLWAGAILTILAGAAAVHAAKRHGPTEPISPRSYAAAWDRLKTATDDHVATLSLPKILLLVFVLLVDGVILGNAMARSLGAFLTPRMATYVAFAWGLTSAALLWHLAVLAAIELRENEARAAIRRLDASSRAEDRARARSFMDTVGSRVGFDLSTNAPYRKRLFLFVVALGLAAASVGLRVAGDRQPLAAAMPDDGSAASSLLRLPGVSAPIDGLRDVPTSALPAEADTSEPTLTDRSRVALVTWLGALVLAMVVVVSAATLYWTLAKSEFVDRVNSPRDRAVVDRFDGADAVVSFNRAHLQNVTAALDSRLQHFAREVELAKRRLAPSEALTWPPVSVSAAEVLAAAMNRSPAPTLLVPSLEGER